MGPTHCDLEMFVAKREGDFHTARQLAHDLESWLERRGLYPLNYSRLEVDAYLASVLCGTSEMNSQIQPELGS